MFRTIGEALRVVERNMVAGRDLKDSTKAFYDYLMIGIRNSLNADMPVAEAALDCWEKLSGQYSFTHSNNALRVMKMMTAELAKAGHCRDDVMDQISRRKPVAKKEKFLPSVEVFNQILESIREHHFTKP